MERRYRVVSLVLHDGESVVDVVRRFNVSRQTVHACLARYETGGLAALADRAHRPKGCAHQRGAPIEAVMLALRSFAYHGGGPGRGGDVTLTLDGESVAEGTLEATVLLVFSLVEPCDVGRDGGLSVSDDYRVQESEFTGTVHAVVIELADGAQDDNHVVDPRQRLATALARQ
jgi:hypothetical protein